MPKIAYCSSFVIVFNQVREMLRNAPGVKVVDDPSNNLYPMPLTATGEWDIEVT